MKRILIIILFFSSFIAKGQIYQKISTWEEYLNNFRVTGMFRPPLKSSSAPDSGSFYYNKADSSYYGWSGNAYRKIGGGADNSITTGSRTATGDYTHDWANHWFYLNNLKALNWNSYAPDPVYPGNYKTFSFYSDSTANTYPLWLRWSLRNTANNQDSLGGDLTFGKNYLQLSNYDGFNFASIYASGNPYFPSVQTSASDGTIQSVLTVGAGTISIDAHDSTRVKLVPAATADTVVGVRSLGFGLNTLVKVPMPSGGSADSATFATNYRVDTGKANLRTQIAGKQPAGNYITALTGDATAGGPGSVPITLATVNSNTGTYYNPYYTVNGKGLITASGERIVRTVTTNTSAAAADGAILCNTASGDITVTISTTTSNWVTIQKISSDFNKVIISPSSGTIRGGSTYELTGTWESVTIFTNGTNFFIK